MPPEGSVEAPLAAPAVMGEAARVVGLRTHQRFSPHACSFQPLRSLPGRREVGGQLSLSNQISATPMQTLCRWSGFSLWNVGMPETHFSVTSAETKLERGLF